MSGVKTHRHEHPKYRYAVWIAGKLPGFFPGDGENAVQAWISVVELTGVDRNEAY